MRRFSTAALAAFVLCARTFANASLVAIPPMNKYTLIFFIALVLNLSSDTEAAESRWRIGTPIATYWAGPAMTEATAQQMADGGWNLVWCKESEMDIARRHGLRAMLQDGLISPKTLDNPEAKAKLDALIKRVRRHPALYAYFLTDEPDAATFPGLGRLVAYLR